MPSVTPSKLYTIIISNADFSLTVTRRGVAETLAFLAGERVMSNAGLTDITYPAGVTISQTNQPFFFNRGAGAGAPYNVPIGSIIAWHKTLAGTPALPGNFVECNGQVLADAASVYNGLTIPNLNADPAGANSPGLARKESMFLRGALTSGTGQDQTTAVNGLTVSNESAHTHGAGTYSISNESSHTHGSGTYGVDAHSAHSVTHNAARITIGASIQIGGGSLNQSSASISVAAHSNHTFSGSSAAGSAHNHTLSGSSAAGSAHNHGLTGDTETRPPNMSVVWIIRVK